MESSNQHLWLRYSMDILVFFVSGSNLLLAQNQRSDVAGIPVNYDESKVPEYDLPELLKLANGKVIKDAKTWEEKRRPEILHLFEDEQFGRVPDRKSIRFEVLEEGVPAFGDSAIRKQVAIHFTPDMPGHKANLLMYTPKTAQGPTPLFLQISFAANCLSVEDEGILCDSIWTREGQRIPADQGRRFGSLNVRKFIEAGIGVATIYYGDIEPDFAGGDKFGIRGSLKPVGEQGQTWGAISAWSWGLSGVMDYLETDTKIDAGKVALFGVSRLGKTVLWTGARDQRFGLVIASCSGEGGAAISRRQYGETIAHMIDSTRYFYQFAGNRTKYGSDPSTCPVDAHMLVALMAPRPLLLQTGDTDYWSDPKGEFDAAVAAEPAYRLYGKKALEVKTWPKPGEAILNDLGYYMHAGGHGTVASDYDVYLQFIKKHFRL